MKTFEYYKKSLEDNLNDGEDYVMAAISLSSKMCEGVVYYSLEDEKIKVNSIPYGTIYPEDKYYDGLIYLYSDTQKMSTDEHSTVCWDCDGLIQIDDSLYCEAYMDEIKCGEMSMDECMCECIREYCDVTDLDLLDQFNESKELVNRWIEKYGE